MFVCASNYNRSKQALEKGKLTFTSIWVGRPQLAWWKIAFYQLVCNTCSKRTGDGDSDDDDDDDDDDGDEEVV